MKATEQYFPMVLLIAHVRYIKIQLETKDITTRLWGYGIRICMVYTIKPRSDVYCFKLIFNISHVGFYPADLVSLLQYFTGETLQKQKV